MSTPTFLLEESDTATIHANREFAEFVQSVSHLLPARDRSLIHLVYDCNAKTSVVAAACGVNVNSLYTRLHRITQRLKDPVTRIIWDTRQMIPPDTSKILLEHFIGGSRMTDLQKKYNVPYPFISKAINTYREYAQSVLDAKIPRAA